MSLYEDWIDAKRQLTEIKKLEWELRGKLEKEIREKQNAIGTVHAHLGGHHFISNVTLSYSIDKQVLFDNEWQLTEEELLCIERKPTINIARYKKLPDASILKKIVTVKPQAPQIKVKEEK